MEDDSSPVLGRDAELRAVDGFLDSARTRFAVLTVEGDAGIGKTTVWREGVRRARARGARLLQTRPSEAEASLSYAGLADLFDAVGDAAVGELAPPMRDAISAALLRAPVPRGGIDERALSAGVLSLLRLLSAEGAIVVAVDDAQWLDTPSARVLSFAARRLDAEAVGIIVTIRTPTSLQLRFDCVPEASRRQTIALGPMSVGALHALIKQHTQRSLPRPTLVQIAGICAGNPFYALEIAAALPERPSRAGPLQVPPSLTELVVGRLGKLPAPTRRALLTAAALSQPSTAVVDETALGAARRAGIVSIDQGRIQFAHPLLASALYGRAGLEERRSLHRRLAGVVTEPEERARHAALGAAEPDAAIARELDEAAVLARARGAPGAAAELLELAVGLTPTSEHDLRATRLVAGAGFRFDAGDLIGAQANLEQAQAGPLAGGPRARALHLMGQIHARRTSFTEAAAVAAQALEAAAGDSGLIAEIELDLAYYSISLGDLAGAAAHARGAVAAAERAGDTGALGDALAVVTMAEFAAGLGFDEDRMRRARELEDPSRIRAWQMTPAFLHGSILLYTGRLEPAFAALSRLHSETIERGEESPIPFSCFYQAWACVWRGHLGVARRLAHEAMQTAALLDDPAAHGIALATSALVHAYDGTADVARDEAAESLRLFRELGWAVGTIWPMWALAVTELSSGNPAAVDRALGPTAAMLTSMGGADPFIGVFLPEEIEALVELGYLDRAEPLVRWLEERGVAVDRAWARAAAGRGRALLCASRGDLDGALTALDEALAQHDRCTMPFERARTLLVLGRVQRRRGERGQARATLEEAFIAFQRFGAPLWAARARLEIERLGRRAASPDALTPVEMRVAELAASGLANAEIGDRAFLSTKAVEANLTRVYRKLGIRSRGGLARALQTSGTRLQEHGPNARPS
ncbi:MAG: AAA family ATPase [Solirubrobacteraceae bacterium]